jgi:hypothetical protein
MHEMEGPRRVLLPCSHRSLGVRRPCRTCSSCSVSRLLASRARGTGCSLRSAGPDCSGPAPTRSGCPSRSAGPDRSGPTPTRSSLLAVRQSRLLGSSSYGERLPRRPGPDRSGPASAGLPRLALPRLLETARRAASSDVRPGDCSPVHTSDLITFLGNPLRTAVSRCPPRPGSRPPGRSPFPVTRRFLVGDHPAPQELSGSIFHEFSHPQGRPQAVDGCPPETRSCPPRHPPVRPQPSSRTSTIWTPSGHPRSGPARWHNTSRATGPVRATVGSRRSTGRSDTRHADNLVRRRPLSRGPAEPQARTPRSGPATGVRHRPPAGPLRASRGHPQVAHPQLDRPAGTTRPAQPVHFAQPGGRRRSTGRSDTRHADNLVRRRPLCAGAGGQPVTYGQWRQPRSQQVPRAARKPAVNTNSPVAGSR